jgi:hypothetical protein
MSKEQDAKKRKKLLAERKRNSADSGSFAYTGSKYKKDELIPTIMHAEIGIYRAFLLSDRTITDQHVMSALDRLIRQLRANALPPRSEAAIPYEVGREEDLLVDNIRRAWAAHYANAWRPERDDLIGCLRTILGSVETWKSPGPQSQGYLRYISGFLTKQVGVSIKTLETEPKPMLKSDSEQDQVREVNDDR